MHTALFNIAARNILRLTPKEEQRVRDQINDAMRGDGLYDGADEETVFEAFYHQESMPNETWAELILVTLGWAGPRKV
jgi:hypothetical protein